METDLKLICDAIPVSNALDVSTQASNILKGITGLEIEFNIAGAMPTLNAPTVTQSGNTVSISNVSSNGNFVTKLAVFINDSLVYESSTTFNTTLTIGASDDLKVLKAVLSGTNFEDGVTQMTLHYIDPSGALTFSFTNSVFARSSYPNRYNSLNLQFDSSNFPNGIIGCEYTINNDTVSLTERGFYRSMLGYKLIGGTIGLVQGPNVIEIHNTTSNSVTITRGSGSMAYGLFMQWISSNPSHDFGPLPEFYLNTDGSYSSMQFSYFSAENLYGVLFDSNNQVIGIYPMDFGGFNGNGMAGLKFTTVSSLAIPAGGKLRFIGTISNT